jgi:hypothetical protein
MRRIKSILAVATALAAMMLAAAPAMASANLGGGTFVSFSSQRFSGNHGSGSDNNVGFGRLRQFREWFGRQHRV